MQLLGILSVSSCSCRLLLLTSCFLSLVAAFFFAFSTFLLLQLASFLHVLLFVHNHILASQLFLLGVWSAFFSCVKVLLAPTACCFFCTISSPLITLVQNDQNETQIGNLAPTFVPKSREAGARIHQASAKTVKQSQATIFAWRWDNLQKQMTPNVQTRAIFLATRNIFETSKSQGRAEFILFPLVIFPLTKSHRPVKLWNYWWGKSMGWSNAWHRRFMWGLKPLQIIGFCSKGWGFHVWSWAQRKCCRSKRQNYSFKPPICFTAETSLKRVRCLIYSTCLCFKQSIPSHRGQSKLIAGESWPFGKSFRRSCQKRHVHTTLSRPFRSKKHATWLQMQDPESGMSSYILFWQTKCYHSHAERSTRLTV